MVLYLTCLAFVAVGATSVHQARENGCRPKVKVALLRQEENPSPNPSQVTDIGNQTGDERDSDVPDLKPKVDDGLEIEREERDKALREREERRADLVKAIEKNSERNAKIAQVRRENLEKYSAFQRDEALKDHEVRQNMQLDTERAQSEDDLERVRLDQIRQEQSLDIASSVRGEQDRAHSRSQMRHEQERRAHEVEQDEAVSDAMQTADTQVSEGMNAAEHSVAESASLASRGKGRKRHFHRVKGRGGGEGGTGRGRSGIFGGGLVDAHRSVNGTVAQNIHGEEENVNSDDDTMLTITVVDRRGQGVQKNKGI